MKYYAETQSLTYILGNLIQIGKPLKIAVLQMEPAAGGCAENFAKIEKAARSASAFDAKLLVTPELSLTGYALGEEFFELAETTDGAMIDRLAKMAAKHNIAIAAGFPECDGETIYNSAVLVEATGKRHFYRKCHLFGSAEKAVFTASNQPPLVFQFHNFKIGLLICFDVEFPEMVRSLALSGAELVVVPTALPNTSDSARVSQQVVPVRAFENHVFVAYADLCGKERALTYHGGSVIVGPDGNALACAGTEETLLITTLEHKALELSHRENPYLKERRPEIYQGI